VLPFCLLSSFIALQILDFIKETRILDICVNSDRLARSCKQNRQFIVQIFQCPNVMFRLMVTRDQVISLYDQTIEFAEDFGLSDILA